MLYHAAREDNPMVQFEISAFADGLLKGCVKHARVIRVNPLARGPITPARRFGIEPIDAKMLFGPEGVFLGLHIPGPTAGVTQPLPFGKIGLGAPQLGLGALAFSDL